MATSSRWTYEQTLIAFRVYLNTEYGKLNQSNAQLAQIADLINRSPSALIMKCCNFASMDPFHAARGVKGLANKSSIEKQIWADFQRDGDAVALQMEAEWERLNGQASDTDYTPDDTTPSIPIGPSEVERVVRTRRLQRAFRASVLVGYKHRCAITGLNIPSLLNASHIIPWSESEGKRADPRNGICLNALHDRAFDRGLFSFDEDYRVIIAADLTRIQNLGNLIEHLKGIEGQKLSMPERFGPSPETITYHRENIYTSI